MEFATPIQGSILKPLKSNQVQNSQRISQREQYATVNEEGTESTPRIIETENGSTFKEKELDEQEEVKTNDIQQRANRLTFGVQDQDIQYSEDDDFEHDEEEDDG